MKFELVRVSKIHNPKTEIFIYGFKFSKNQQFSEIFTNSETIFIAWKKLLTLAFIQTSFHEDFSVTKMIGKGSFAKVFFKEIFFENSSK